MKKFFVYLSLTIIFLNTIDAQVPELKKTFLEAESYFLFEEYNEALPLYLRIQRADPENDNINYKIGVCFLNDPFQNDKSIRYLEKASANINPKYKDNNFKEITAPVETFFYLGKAYLVNNNIDKALENFKYFREILDEDIYDTELIEEQIRICERARNLMRMPVDFDRVNLASKINGRFSDINPIVSGNGKRLVYVSKLQFYDAAFVSENVDGEWQPPRNIVPELGVDGDVYPTALSWDGNTMIIYRNDEFIGNLYVSHLIDGIWSKMQKLGDEINTKFWESHGSLSKDGRTLYFTSNRKGGYGGLDIYKSEMDENGDWGNPMNLGPEINSRYNEETPYITENGQLLYFSSYGHYNMGGYDVFYSKKGKNNKWAEPINLGYPINSTDDDLFFHPMNNGDNAYFSLFGEEGFGRHDIYYMNVYSDNNPRMYLVSGHLGSRDGELEDEIFLYLVDLSTNDTIVITQPDQQQDFAFKAAQGEYNLIFNGESYEELIRELRIDETTDKAGIIIAENILLKPLPKTEILVGEDSRIVLSDTAYTTEEGAIVEVKMRLEKEGQLVADVYHDKVLTQSDTFDIDKKRFTYEVTPKLGKNTVTFQLSESDGTLSISEVSIDVKPKTIQDKPEKEEAENNGKNTIQEKEGAIDNTGLENVIIDSTTVIHTPPAIDQTIKFLLRHTEGNLKLTLGELDPRAEAIEDSNGILQYLEEKANIEGYTQQDIDGAVGNAVAEGNVALLHKQLTKHANKPLGEFLNSLDPEVSNSLDMETYVRHIRREALNNRYTNNDLTEAFGEALNEVSSDAALLRIQMLQYVDDDLKEVLNSIDLNGKQLTSKEDLLKYLEDMGVSKTLSKETGALTKANGNADELKILLLQHTKSEDLHEFLLHLNLENDSIESAGALISYLKHVDDEKIFSQEDLYTALHDIYTKKSSVQETLEELLSYAEDNLHDYLGELDLVKSGIYSSKQLLNHLVEKSGERYSDELLTSVLLSVIGNDNLNDLLRYMIVNAPKSISKILKELDLEALGIDSISKLLAYLIEHSEELGYSQDEMQKILLELLSGHLVNTISDELGGQEKSRAKEKILGGSILLVGALIFIIFFLRKEKKEIEES